MPSGCVEFDTYNVKDGGAGGSSSSSGGGEGGTGGMMGTPCTTVDDCPKGMVPACRVNIACNNNVCEWDDVPNNTPVPGATQVYGDCNDIVCDGKGGSTDNTNVDEKYDWGNTCYVPTCGTAVPMSKGMSTTCTTPWGNANGHCEAFKCVECSNDSECGANVCVSGKCVAMHCKNMTLDMGNGETDIDCGGPCIPCGDGKECLSANDCTSGVCNGGTCAVPACNDAIRNGDETDNDCGGGCAPCAKDKKCLYPKDCESGSCEVGVCK